MAIKLFGSKQPTAAEVEKKLEEISAKRQRLDHEIQNMRDRLVRLDDERQDALVEAIMADSADAEECKEALDEEKIECNRRISAGTADLASIDALLSQMESEMKQARGREHLAEFDRERDKILTLCPQIQEHLAKLGSLLRQVRSSAQAMNDAGGKLTGRRLAFESTCADAIGACAARHLDGVMPGFPSRANYRAETVAAAESLQKAVRERFEAQRETLTSALSKVTEEQPV